MTAGVDSFSSSMFAQFDVTFLAVEPTMRSMDVFKAYSTYASTFGITPLPVGSKVRDADDTEFLSEKLQSNSFPSIPFDEEIRHADRDARPVVFEMLSDTTHSALEHLTRIVLSHTPDRARRKKITDAVHRKNARVWGNTRKGTDLTHHVDDAFVPAP